ncbi:MAG: lysophospholipid acyltransferase family protein [Planctomycetes bacterium]|nr:lysophospholipid acyltransferase family protein [Planctomycetota bacterium]
MSSARLRDIPLYLLVRALEVLLSIPGRPTALRCGAWLGTLVWALDDHHRRRTRDQIAASLGPFRDPDAPGRLSRRAYEHLGTMLAEMLLYPRCAGTMIAPELRIEGTEHYEATLRGGHPTILVTGHLGNWEYAIWALRRVGILFTGIERPLDNPLLGDYLNRKRRTRIAGLIPQEGALRRMLRLLQEGKPIGLLVDQDAGRHGRFVPFFGRTASTLDTPAALALRTGAWILPIGLQRARRSPWYRFRFAPPIVPRPTGDRDADIHDLTSRYTAAVEALIRLAPEQWLWMHRRWRTRPEGEAPDA